MNELSRFVASRREAAARLGISLRKLDAMRASGTGPAWTKWPDGIAYLRHDVELFRTALLDQRAPVSFLDIDPMAIEDPKLRDALRHRQSADLVPFKKAVQMLGLRARMLHYRRERHIRPIPVLHEDRLYYMLCDIHQELEFQAWKAACWRSE